MKVVWLPLLIIIFCPSPNHPFQSFPPLNSQLSCFYHALAEQDYTTQCNGPIPSSLSQFTGSTTSRKFLKLVSSFQESTFVQTTEKSTCYSPQEIAEVLPSPSASETPCKLIVKCLPISLYLSIKLPKARLGQLLESTD